MSWAACLPEDEAVVVVLTNHEVDDGHFAFFPRVGPSARRRPSLMLTASVYDVCAATQVDGSAYRVHWKSAVR